MGRWGESSGDTGLLSQEHKAASEWARPTGPGSQRHREERGRAAVEDRVRWGLPE